MESQMPNERQWHTFFVIRLTLPTRATVMQSFSDSPVRTLSTATLVAAANSTRPLQQVRNANHNTGQGSEHGRKYATVSVHDRLTAVLRCKPSKTKTVDTAGPPQHQVV